MPQRCNLSPVSHGASDLKRLNAVLFLARFSPACAFGSNSASRDLACTVHTFTRCQRAHTRFLQKRCVITQSDAGGAQLMDRQLEGWDRGASWSAAVLCAAQSAPASHLETKRPVWVHQRCLQLCCFFTLLAKCCLNTHSSLTMLYKETERRE